MYFIKYPRPGASGVIKLIPQSEKDTLPNLNSIGKIYTDDIQLAQSELLDRVTDALNEFISMANHDREFVRFDNYLPTRVVKEIKLQKKREKTAIAEIDYLSLADTPEEEVMFKSIAKYHSKDNKNENKHSSNNLDAHSDFV